MSAQDIELLFIINFFIYAASLGTGIFLAYQLFRLLEKKHPSYYKSIGKPIVLAPADISLGIYIQLIKGGLFGYGMVFRGIPKNFPKDSGLRKLAQAIRVVLSVLIFLFVTVIITGYFFYQSGL